MLSNKPINPIVRKLKYLAQFWPIIKGVSNWYQVPLLLFLPLKKVTLKLKTGERFKITHYLDALTIKEIYLDKDYKINTKAKDIIIDIGANIGTYSILQARNNPKATVFSFEPAPKTFQLLKENIRLNKVSNIKTFKLGVAKSEGTRVFYSHKASGLSSLSQKRQGMTKNRIKTTTLVNIFKSNKLKYCDVLKMDCEGAEYEVLFNTQTRLFSKINSLVIEYHDSLTDYTHKELKDFLKQKGYQVKLIPHNLETDIGILFATK